jgi:FKBP12-rapamycin complex-associated protein
MYIFRSLRLKCVVFLPMVRLPLCGAWLGLLKLHAQVMPSYIAAMRASTPSLIEYYFQNLGQLITMIKQHARAFLPSIIALIHDYWGNVHEKTSHLQTVIVELIESIAVALQGEFKVYLPTLLPPLLAVFDDPEPARISTQLRVLRAFGIFGLNLEEYLHLVVPVIVRAFERTGNNPSVRKSAVATLAILCRKINFADHASRVIHPLTRVLASSSTELRGSIMDCFCALITQIGSDFAIFVPMINKVRKGIVCGPHLMLSIRS